MTDPAAFSTLLTVYILFSLRMVGLFFSSPPFTASSLPLPLRFWLAFLLGVLGLSGNVEVPSLDLLSGPFGGASRGCPGVFGGVGVRFSFGSSSLHASDRGKGYRYADGGSAW